MENFTLMDGAMAFDRLSASDLFSKSTPSWFQPIFPHKDLRLAGPLLIAHTRVPQGSAEWREIAQINGAFPLKLHLSVIRAGLEIDALAAHLRRFACFTDSCGDTYGLRIGDACVLAHLPTSLSSEQWTALTAPMDLWEMPTREGKWKVLSLPKARYQVTGEATQLQLSDDQIDRLIDASAPDALLEQIDVPTTDLASAQHLQVWYEVSCSCIRHWKSSGSTDRGVLIDFARRVFQLGARNHGDASWMVQRLREVSSTPEQGGDGR